MKFGTLMHIGFLNPMKEKKLKFKNPRWQKAIILKMKMIIYPFKFSTNVE